MYLLLCLFSSAMAVLALSSWAAKQGSGFAVDELTGQLTGIGDYRRAVVQAGAAAIGILVAILLSNIDYRSLVNVWPVHVVLTWGLVLPTLVIRNVTIGPLTIGYNAGDTDNYSWYKLGGFTLQPTELAKISFILTFAMHLNNVRSRINEPKELAKLLLHLLVPIAIIHVQGDDGTAIIYGIIGCCMMFAAGLSWKYIFAAFAAAGAAVAVAFAFFSDKIGKGYQWYRILAVLDPENTTGWAPSETVWKNIIYQQQRGEIALGSGGIFGNGLFTGRYYSVPNAHNDFIFSWIGNAAGFVGCCVVLGVLLAMMNYASQFWGPINQLANIYNNFINNVAYLERIFEMIDEPVEVQDAPGAAVLPEIRGDVEFHDVSFAYEKDILVLKHVNFHVKQGESVALVGHTGSGKTTIINLLSRFYNCTEGRVTIDGVDISGVTLASLRAQMGLMMQESFVFTGTVMDNLRYGNLAAGDEELIRAAELVCADGFIRALPHGYDTVLTEGGAMLSQGEKQLLALARTMASDPKVLILDEATSSVDTKTERELQEGVNRMLKGRTSFIVAHRLSTIRACNKIMYIDHGEIAECGTHEELLARKGLYWQLCQEM